MNRTETFDALALHTISIRLAWATLEILSDEVSAFQLLVSGDDMDVEDLKVSTSEGTLTIEQPAYGLTRHLTVVRWMQVILRVPREWKGAVDASTIAGPLKARGLSGTDLTLDTVSGDLHVMSLKAIGLGLHTVTGVLVADGLSAEQLNLRTVSARLAAEHADAEKVRISTVSGDVSAELSGRLEKLDVNTVAGDVQLTVPFEAANISYRAATGKLRTSGVSIAEEGPEVSVTSVSGSLLVARGSEESQSN